MSDTENPVEVKSRKERPTGSTHIGDVDFDDEKVEEIGDASWGEVCRTCCVHDAQGWGLIFIGLLMVCFCLYFFLVGLNLIGTAAKVVGGCTAGSLFGDDTNPVAALMVGILATVLIQSSSSTTSIIVALVGDGITVKTGIYMVMGANIGTSVTNTLVAMGHLGDGDELERAFAGATVHDMFNFCAVAILFPLEIISHFLFHVSNAMVSGQANRTGQGDKWEGPVKKLVSPFGSLIIIANKKVTTIVAKGGTCDALYPVECSDPDDLSYESCNKNGRVGLISCNKKSGSCPAFFQNGASRGDDETSGAVVFFLGLAILIICLIGLVTVLQKMLMGMSTRIIYKATNINGYLAILIGAGITVLVQSSSITTSALTPFVGMGALRLEQMFPLTLGANIGTTVTGLLASLVNDGTDSLQVALCHLLFNITGIIIWYPVPFMRNIPLSAAKALGKATRVWRGFPLLYILVTFLGIPLLLFGLSSLFEQDSKGFTVLGSFIVIILALVFAYFLYNWYKGGLKEKTFERFAARQRRTTAAASLADDMDFCKAEIARLTEHTGLPEAEVEMMEKEESSEEASA